MNLIQTQQLNFSFGRQQVIKELNLAVPTNTIYGFLGPNGAGKSTTIKLLLGLLKSPKGSIHLFGKELSTNRKEILAQLGNLIETPSIYDHLTAWDNLKSLDFLFQKGKKRISEVLALVGLGHASRKKVKHFSLGMKQRLGIGMALFNDPELIILDEPVNGLDPSSIQEMRRLFLQLQELGKTLFISSHLLSEIEKVCNHVGIIQEGQLVYQGKMEDLLANTSKKVLIKTPNPKEAIQLIQGYLFEVDSNLNDNGSLLVKIGSREDFNHLVKLLVKNDIEIYDLTQKSASLEDIFLSKISQKEKMIE